MFSVVNNIDRNCIFECIKLSAKKEKIAWYLLSIVIDFFIINTYLFPCTINKNHSKSIKFIFIILFFGIVINVSFFHSGPVFIIFSVRGLKVLCQMTSSISYIQIINCFKPVVCYVINQNIYFIILIPSILSFYVLFYVLKPIFYCNCPFPYSNCNYCYVFKKVLFTHFTSTLIKNV